MRVREGGKRFPDWPGKATPLSVTLYQNAVAVACTVQFPFVRIEPCVQARLF